MGDNNGKITITQGRGVKGIFNDLIDIIFLLILYFALIIAVVLTVLYFTLRYYINILYLSLMHHIDVIWQQINVIWHYFVINILPFIRGAIDIIAPLLFFLLLCNYCFVIFIIIKGREEIINYKKALVTVTFLWLKQNLFYFLIFFAISYFI